jgi:hypothetical protein
MLIGKQIADLITALRGVLGIGLILLGWLKGEAGLSFAAWLMIANWTGDILDGAFARWSRQEIHTWIGDHDLEVDMFVSLGLLIYLLQAEYVSLLSIAVYLFIWLVIFWRWGLLRALGMLIQAPIYGWFIWIAVLDASLAGWAMVAWIAGAVILTWPRFPEQVIPGFLHNIYDFWENRLRRSS